MGRARSVPRLRLVALGFLAVAALLALFLWVIGIGDVLTALQSAKLWVLPLILGAALCWLVLWSQSLGTVLTLLGVEHTRSIQFLAYLGIVFSNNVTPFAQAGAEPLAALVVARATGTRYEVSLSAVASVDALNVFPSVGLATVSLVYLLLKTALDPRVELAAVLFVGLAVLTTILGLAVWRNRARLGRVVRTGASWVGAALDRHGIQAPFRRQIDVRYFTSDVISGIESPS